MPIVDIELVSATDAEFTRVSAREIADALGAVFGSAPGRTWVRLRRLDGSGYAENQVDMEGGDHPVFVTILHAHLPTGPQLESEAVEVTRSVARCLGRSAQRVHVEYAPPGAGRQAFGGRLVR